MAAPMFSTVVTGDAQIRRRLQAVGQRMGGRGLIPALTAAALIVENAAKGKAAYRTGTLRRSIHTKTVSSHVVAVGTDVPYARRIEYGFADTDILGRTYHQPAQPYLRPALDENQGEMRREFADALGDLLRASLR